MLVILNAGVAIVLAKIMAFLAKCDFPNVKLVFVAVTLDAVIVLASIYALHSMPYLPTAIVLSCVLGPIAEEITRANWASSEKGFVNAVPISIAIGLIESIFKSFQVIYLREPSALDNSFLVYYTLLATSISIIFHANMGVISNILGKKLNLIERAFCCTLIHSAANFIVLLTEPFLFKDKLSHLCAILAIYTISIGITLFFYSIIKYKNSE